MITTLAAIHHDPAILDRAIASRERLDIVAGGEVTATLLPAAPTGVEEARRVMRERFDAPDWEFTVGQPPRRRQTDLTEFADSLRLVWDPLDWQHRVRGEWE